MEEYYWIHTETVPYEGIMKVKERTLHNDKILLKGEGIINNQGTYYHYKDMRMYTDYVDGDAGWANWITWYIASHGGKK